MHYNLICVKYCMISGDGTLSAFDIRKHKLKVQSELFDSDLLSLAVVKVSSSRCCYYYLYCFIIFILLLLFLLLLLF